MKLQDPVIVMGMAQCGTSLLAEMVHRGGTPMFAGNADPSYDDGIKYERPLCQAINRRLLGVARDGDSPHSTLPLWTWPLHPFPHEELEVLQEEVKDEAWGFKDPRTTLTYSGWLEAFPGGPRLYTYRSHTEYLRRSLRVQKKYSLRRARRQMQAWLSFNEALARNCDWDLAAGRRWALVSYERLMERDELRLRLQIATGVPLADARNPRMHRTRSRSLPLRDRLYVLYGEAGQRARLRAIYAKLQSLELGR
jgi:hypothetical protein